jgi:amino acid permease
MEKPRFESIIFEKSNEKFIQSLAIIFTASNFQVNLFPIYRSQKDKRLP